MVLGGTPPKNPNCLVNLKDAHCGDQIELEVRDQNETVIGCKSGCSAFNRDDLCCTGAYNLSRTCKPSIYSLTLKKLCDKAITYPYDDETLFTCRCNATKLLIKNNCPHKIWPATQSGTGEGAAIPTGFRLASRGTKKFNLPNPWSGRIWARHLCSYSGQNFTCLSGDCRSGSIECDGAGGTPPATLVQFTIANTSDEKDFYSVSIVDGFNLPVSVTPINRPDCGIADCLVNLKDAHCGDQIELEVRDQNEDKMSGAKADAFA
ncbi:hypothetical protein H5410_019540 [Solanum commersonii]|uniref:Thaumatin-like protein n=1 Tax=Solanum commersonii TaxID=4109 RepID=A0A9J5Z5I7_SOLCO|nr:hypothetical protein H5410_019540 [Solanum commersonii]